MPLPEAGIGLLKKFDLFFCQVHILAVFLFFQAKKGLYLVSMPSFRHMLRTVLGHTVMLCNRR